MPRNYFVYILASQRNGTLYIGVTNNLQNRVQQHKNLQIDGFTKKYKVTTLVYYEVFSNVSDAIVSEKRLKKWNRAWKIRVIQKFNPTWRDLFFDV